MHSFFSVKKRKFLLEKPKFPREREKSKYHRREWNGKYIRGVASAISKKDERKTLPFCCLFLVAVAAGGR